MWKTFLAVVLVAAFASGCNTFKGMGQDIERGGERLENAAERNK